MRTGLTTGPSEDIALTIRAVGAYKLHNLCGRFTRSVAPNARIKPDLMAHREIARDPLCQNPRHAAASIARCCLVYWITISTRHSATHAPSALGVRSWRKVLS